MFGLKKQLIKNYINLRVVENAVGKLTLQVNNLNQLEEQYKQFDVYIKNFINKLEGVELTEVDYPNNRIMIYYNTQKLSPQKIFKWTDIIVDVIIDKLDIIKRYWETDIKYVETILTNILENKLKMLG